MPLAGDDPGATSNLLPVHDHVRPVSAGLAGFRVVCTFSEDGSPQTDTPAGRENEAGDLEHLSRGFASGLHEMHAKVDEQLLLRT